MCFSKRICVCVHFGPHQSAFVQYQEELLLYMHSNAEKNERREEKKIKMGFFDTFNGFSNTITDSSMAVVGLDCRPTRGVWRGKIFMEKTQILCQVKSNKRRAMNAQPHARLGQSV